MIEKKYARMHLYQNTSADTDRYLHMCVVIAHVNTRAS